MGHLVGKDIFRSLGRKIDSLEMRAPWNEKLHAILKALYSEEEAAVVIGMPNGLSTIDEIARTTGRDRGPLLRILEGLAGKGLVIDFCLNGEYRFTPSPMVVGIFEFTMMRMGPDTDTAEWARLLHDYMEKDGAFLNTNFGHGDQLFAMRTMPHEQTVRPEEYFEVLDYEKASAVIEENDRFAIGICSCRHKMLHLGEKTCAVPLEKCSQFGYAADFMIRHNLSREVSRSEMLDNFAQSREMGLVLGADNVSRNIKFVCHCCGCCCGPLLGISKYGYANTIVTSRYIAGIAEEKCVGCGKCVEACPIKAVTMTPPELPEAKRGKAKIDESICIGCGVCALKCPTKGCFLVKRKQRVLHPETTFERLMLQCLEKGTLQNQIFNDPSRIDHRFMRAFVGGFLNLPPVKKALMSERLRSSFLQAMKEGVKKQGKGWVMDL